MKRILFFLFLCSLLIYVSGFPQIPKRISYQGLLTTSGGGTATNGDYHISFNIYDSLSGGSRLWSENQDQVAVSKGTFHVILGSNIPLDLPFDRSYYMEMTVTSGPGISAPVTILPRSEFTSSPYSFRADSALYAQAANIPNGTVVKSVNGLRDNITLNGAGGATVTSSGDSLIITASGGGGTGIQGVQNTNSTLDISNPNGPTATINLKLPLSATASTSAATVGVTNQSSGPALSGLSASGIGVLGGSTDAGQFGVWGTNSGGGYGVGGLCAGTSTAGVWGANTGYGIGLLGTSSNGVAVKGSMTGTGRAAYFEINNPGSNNSALYAITNGTGPAMHASGNGPGRDGATLRLENTNLVNGMCTYATNKSTWATAHFQNDSSGQILWLQRSSPGSFIVAYNNGYKFWVDDVGETHTQSLEILGGADLSERFEIESADVTIEPGMVVSIDAEHEGKLVVSRDAYDRRVAGIISGAGKIKPGMLMGQEGTVASGAHAVALTGRVYCKAVGPIEPGDLLTTSNIPGHAMKAIDRERSQGAIIGKAMSRLERGTGLVLILVNLQ